MNPGAMYKISYGLYILTAKNEYKDNGCIINTVSQLTSSPNRIMIGVNKANYTNEMITETGVFNISVLTQQTPFSVFKRFGFASGRNTDKFDGFDCVKRSENGLLYVTENTNAYLSCKVTDMYDYGSHTLFIAEVADGDVLSNEPAVTYQYYFDHIKPKANTEKKKGFVCKICGYVYEGETLPKDFVCPICKHGAEDFEPIK